MKRGSLNHLLTPNHALTCGQLSQDDRKCSIHGHVAEQQRAQQQVAVFAQWVNFLCIDGVFACGVRIDNNLRHANRRVGCMCVCMCVCLCVCVWRKKGVRSLIAIIIRICSLSILFSSGQRHTHTHAHTHHTYILVFDEDNNLGDALLFSHAIYRVTNYVEGVCVCVSVCMCVCVDINYVLAWLVLMT